MTLLCGDASTRLSLQIVEGAGHDFMKGAFNIPELGVTVAAI
jgi:hypothetical protein